MGDLYSGAFGSTADRDERVQVVVREHPGEHVYYRVTMHEPQCFDNGDWVHDQWWSDETHDFEAVNSMQAANIIARDYIRSEACKSHPPQRMSFVTKLEIVRECKPRVTEVKIPTW